MPENPEDRIEDVADESQIPNEIVSAVDEGSGDAALVIADIDNDDAWISMDVDVAPTLSNWR